MFFPLLRILLRRVIVLVRLLSGLLALVATEPHDCIGNRKHDNGRDGGREEENLYYTHKHIRILIQYSYIYVVFV
jgi:hypothetical protein